MSDAHTADMAATEAAIRATHGLPARSRDESLSATAQDWAEHLARTRMLSHGNMSARAASHGWTGTTLAENVAMGSRDAAGTYRQWMGSAGHRRNILDRTTNVAGFGHAVASDGSHYWAANYGKTSGDVSGEMPPPQPPPWRNWLVWLLPLLRGKT